MLTAAQVQAGLSGNPGFEDNSTGYTFSPAGPFSINSNATYIRSGTKSLRLSTTATSDQKAYHTAGAAIAPVNGYVTVMAWIKGENAQLNTKVGVYNASTSVETPAASYTTIGTATFQVISSSFPCVAGQTYYPILLGRSISGSTATGEFDDVVMYFHTASGTDITKPAISATTLQGSANGTGVTLSWTDGSDAESGLDGYLVVRLSGISTTAINPLAQTNYSTVSTQGPTSIGTATVVYNGTAATCTDDPGVAGPYTYLVFTRDKAYNYTASTSPARIITLNGAGQSSQIANSISVDGICLPAGNTFTVNSGVTLTIKTAADISIEGTLVETGTITNNGDVTFTSGSTYHFDRNGGSLIYAEWQPGSLCYITGIKNTAPDGFDQTFDNVTWNCTQQNRNITLDATFNVNGDLLIQSTSTRRIVLEDNTVKGDLIQSGGTVWFSAGTSLKLSGTQLQELEVTGPVYGLEINNPSGVHLAENLTVNEVLQLTDGNFDNSDHMLTMASNAELIRDGGSIQDTPDLNGSINLTYTSPATTSGEIPLSGIQNLTINAGGMITLASDLNVSGTLTFTSGYINTTAADPLILSATATVSGASSSSHVIGPVSKKGNTAFTFPTGNGTVYAPISISAPALVTDQYTAEYIPGDASAIGTNLETNLARVSSTEYWSLQRNTGTSLVSVNLTWNPMSMVSSLAALRVARWNNTEWISEGNAATTGNTSQGTITSNAVGGYGTFTLGSSAHNYNWLPVELISFTSECKGNGTLLKWMTASETNNQYFEILRSENAKDYHSIGTVAAVSNSSSVNTYNFRDNAPGSKISYYQLRQVDFDGVYIDYGPVSSTCNQKKFMYVINNNTLTFLNPDRISESSFRMRITDLTGRLVADRRLDTHTGQYQFPLDKIPVHTMLICNITDDSGNYYPLKFYSRCTD